MESLQEEHIQKVEEKKIEMEKEIEEHGWGLNDLRRLQTNNPRLIHTIRASKYDYAEWLQGYLANGGTITEYHNYDFPSERFFPIYCDFKVPQKPLIAIYANHYIIMDGATVTNEHEDTGNKIYYMDNFRTNDGGVACYNDIAKIVDELNGVKVREKNIRKFIIKKTSRFLKWSISFLNNVVKRLDNK